MPFLVILKRFEVWLLLAIVAALAAFAFQPEPSAEDPPAPAGVGLTAAVSPDKPTKGDPAAPPEEDSVLSLGAVKVEPSGGGWIVETTLAGKSPTGSDLVLDESSVTAATDRGEPVARFFEPFRGTATLAGGEDSMATLRWWLPRPADSLRLDVEGESLAVDLP
ncbi:MAG: hypothetical protein KGR69_06205 [Verrucomicrobia bacterium]|nr:hypothetical protein [Verrucomicrobiota bacterium]